MRQLIKGATIVTMDSDLGDIRGDILIVGGKIAALGSNLVAEGAQEIDAAGKIAIPGIIDTHNCVWQTAVRGCIPDVWADDYYTKLMPARHRFTADDNYRAGYVGGSEMLSYGTTTVVDYCHNISRPGMAEGAISGLQESGIRHVFTYSFLRFAGDSFGSFNDKLNDARRIFDQYHRPESLTTIAFGTDAEGSPLLEPQLEFARSCGAGSCIHINKTGEIERLAARNLLGPDLIAVHGNLIADDELTHMAAVGMPITFTVPVDVQGTPADVVSRALAKKVPVVFGCDVASHVASDLLHQLRVMFYIQGFIDGEKERQAGGDIVRRPKSREMLPSMRPRDLLRLATIDSAKAFGMDKTIGSISPGKSADLVLVDRGLFGDSVDDDPCAHILLQTSARSISDVFVNGVRRVANGALMKFNPSVAANMHIRGKEIFYA